MPGWKTMCDLTIGTNPDDSNWNDAAEFVKWVIENEGHNRQRIAADILAGNYSGIDARPNDFDSLPSVAEVEDGLKLFLVDLVNSSASWWKLSYDCLELPQGEIFGAHQVSLESIDGVDRLKLRASAYLSNRINHFFDRPIPNDVEYIADSIPEQFMATVRDYSKEIDLEDRELSALLRQAIEDGDREAQAGSVSRRAYYREMATILKAIRDGAE